MTKDHRVDKWVFNKWKEPVILVTSFLVISFVIISTTFPGLGSSFGLLLALTAWVIILYFYRDPDRDVVNQPGLIVGPCDGKVVSIEQFREERYLNRETTRISIFLSLFDVHVQRIPLEGDVTLVDHQPGKYLQAFRAEASEVNEFIAMQLKTPYGDLLVKQIAGILARRCINYAREGEKVLTGQRFGHIKFGSRVDLFIPLQAEVLINIGDKVYGGLTAIAKLANHNNE